jgi:glycosyltransferase involved in cell wall biosynthesis
MSRLGRLAAMRIAVDALGVIPGETGGGETYLASLLRAMEESPERRSHEVAVHCTVSNRVLFRERGAVRLVAHDLDNRSRARRLLFEHLRLRDHLAKDGTDVLFAPGNALPARVPCRTVLGVQSLHAFVVPEEMSKFRVAYFRRVVPWSARRADRVLCVSEDLRRKLLQVVPGLDASKVRVVLEGAPDDVERVEDDARVAAVCREFGVEPGRFLLYVSSLNPFKRPETAVAAVAARRSRGEDWPLVLAGRADGRRADDVRAVARAGGVEDLVRIVGTVDRGRLAALYTGARVMLYPSTVETFGLPPLEAMACGTPVVASNRTSIPEVCGDAALLADPDDREAFGEAVFRALHDEDLRRTLVERGRRRVAELTWRQAALGTYALCEEAAASR